MKTLIKRDTSNGKTIDPNITIQIELNANELSTILGCLCLNICRGNEMLNSLLTLGIISGVPTEELKEMISHPKLKTAPELQTMLIELVTAVRASKINLSNLPK